MLAVLWFVQYLKINQNKDSKNNSPIEEFNYIVFFPPTAFEGNYWSHFFLQKQKETLQRSKYLTCYLMFMLQL